MTPVTSLPDPSSRAGEVLVGVHAAPGIARSELAARLGISTGLASDLVARLREDGLLLEGPPSSTGERGRPTRTLWPHPEGPLVAAVAIAHETWRLRVVELGGGVVSERRRDHDRDPARTLRAVAGALSEAWRDLGSRLGAIGVAIPGTVSGTRLVQAPNLGWSDVDLARLRPAGADRVALVADNDAHLSAVGELARGAIRGADSALVLHMDSGVGGALVDGGRITTGAHGMTGEFGHMPLSGSRRPCRCGARGCWNVELDGPALARRLGELPPVDEVSYSRAVITAAADGAGPERRAAHSVARVLARGIAGLVNANDPEAVVLCGLAADLYGVSASVVDPVYRDGLMSARRKLPPPLVIGALGEDGPVVGAGEAAWAALLAAAPTGGG